MKYFVYALVDPRNPSRVRYVGMTSNPKQREQEHRRAWKGGTPERREWLRRLKEQGVRPDLIVLHECTSKADAREWEWLETREHRRRGNCDLNASLHAPASLDKLIAAEIVDSPREVRMRAWWA